MHNPWKLATLGLVALGAIVGTSTLTTAYLMRPAATVSEAPPGGVAEAVSPRPAVVRVAPVPRRSAPVAPAVSPRSAPVVRESAPAAAPIPAPVVTPVAAPVVTPAIETSAPAAPSAPADCDTGGDRALRIAKPGALGAVLGAGLGAAGGAMANGGKGAGKGALIGGVAGAALGAGYGAYKTKNECGTILGDERSKTSGRVAPTPTRDETTMAPLRGAAPAGGRIQIYEAR